MATVVGTKNRSRYLTAHTIMGDKVVNARGEDLGDIKDLMVDLDKGCISYAVLEFGGFLGTGEKLFAIPWQAFTVDEDNERLILNVDKERLQNAPGFGKDRWPDTADPMWSRRIDEYYGYGQRAGTGMGTGGTYGGLTGCM